MASRASLAWSVAFLLLCSVVSPAPVFAQPIIAGAAMAANTPTTFKGSVVDESGAPLPDVNVLAVARVDTLFTSVVTKIKTRSDKDGAFRVSVPAAAKSVQFLVVKDGFAPVRVVRRNTDGTAAGTDGPETLINVVLQRIVPLRVRFVGEKAQPVATAAEDTPEEMQLDGTSPGPGDGMPLLAHSDKDGWMTIRRFGKTTAARILVAAPGFQRIWVNLSVPEDDGLTVRLLPGTTVRGRLVGAHGEPLPNVALGFQNGAELMAPTKSDANGRFEFSGVGADSHVLVSDTFGIALAPTIINGRTPELGEIRATPGGAVAGTVTIPPDVKNSPVPVGLDSLSISATRLDSATRVPADPNLPEWRQTAEVEDDGHYSLRLAPGRYTISLNSWALPTPQLATQTIEVREGNAQTLDWTVPKPNRQVPGLQAKPAAATLMGTTKDANGQLVVAQVSVWDNAECLFSKSTDAGGHWALGPFSMLHPPQTYLIRATAAGFAPAFAVVAPSCDTPIAIKLSLNEPVTLRVTDLQGASLAGARIETDSLAVFGPAMGDGTAMLSLPYGVLPPSIQRFAALCNQHGEATVSGLPTGVYFALKVHCDGYSDGIFTISMPRAKVVELPMSREITFGGRVLLRDPDAPGGGRPLDSAAMRTFGMRMKMQAWSGPWATDWRMSDVRADGSFFIRNIPALDMIGEPAYTYNLDITIPWGYSPNVTMNYMLPGSNWNLHVTTVEKGKIRHWISYVHGTRNGLVYGDGEQVYDDVFLEPLAIVRGTIKEWQPGTNYSISYHDERSIYEDWSVKPDWTGHFEILVPTGDVTLHFPDGQQTLRDLKAGEERNIELSPDPLLPTPVTNGAVTHTLTVRVLGPDGATVPRSIFHWTPVQENDTTVRQTIYGRIAVAKPSVTLEQETGMDGRAEFSIRGADSIEISSPYLDAPLTLVLTKAKDYVTVKLNRLPDAIPPHNDYGNPADSTNSGADNDLVPVQIGDGVTTLPVAKWVRGNAILGAHPLQHSVDLTAGRGKVVVLLDGGLSEDDTERLNQLAARFRNRPILFIVMLPPRVPVSDDFLDNVPSSFAVAMDADAPQGGRIDGAGMKSLNSSSGSAIIGPDGRLLAAGLSEPYLSAAIASALDSVPAANTK